MVGVPRARVAIVQLDNGDKGGSCLTVMYKLLSQLVFHNIDAFTWAMVGKKRSFNSINL